MTDIKEQLLERLRDPSPEARRRAVLESHRLPTAEVADIVLTALGDDDWRVRKEAALYAAEISDNAEVRERLIAATTEDENIGLRNSAVEALSNSRSGVIDRIIERASSADPDHRRTRFFHRKLFPL